MTPVDPLPFTQFGILGILGVVIVILTGVVWKLFTQQSSVQQARDKTLMDFVDRHRSETTAAYTSVAATVASSYDGLRKTLDRQSRMMDELLMAQRVLDQIEKMKKDRDGVVLNQTEIEGIVRSIMHERASMKGPE